ncbi:hypothetical protein NEDG_01220 [Nematocida displodere]|uniref:SET domain-containing protein n=1 Tax=Nematocida displodere TaxID=1805483 RepID=A0A177EC44_9MICR|nr:hypothetical protein NEDG_01220 [Nematocida displodere]
MFLRVGLNVCSEETCLNNREIIVSSCKAVRMKIFSYCSRCTESGFDYVYTNDVLQERNGEYQKTSTRVNTLLEESLFIQRVGKKRAGAGGVPPIGVFTRKEYLPNDEIGFIGGVILKASVQKGALAKRATRSCRSFILREDDLIIDSRRIGNLSRFIRRSCRPNVGIAIASLDDEWKTLPPLKKGHDLSFSCQAKLYALSKIYPNSELFVDTRYSARENETWRSSNSLLSLSEYQDSCACVSKGRCLFCSTYTGESFRPRVSNNTTISAMFVKMHQYIERQTLPPLDYPIHMQTTCTFIHV